MARRSKIMAGVFPIGLLLVAGWVAAAPMAAEVNVLTEGDNVMVQAVVRDLVADAVVFAPQVVTRKGEDARAETIAAEGKGGLYGRLQVEFDDQRMQVTVEVGQDETTLYRSRFTVPAP